MAWPKFWSSSALWKHLLFLASFTSFLHTEPLCSKVSAFPNIQRQCLPKNKINYLINSRSVVKLLFFSSFYFQLQLRRFNLRETSKHINNLVLTWPIATYRAWSNLFMNFRIDFSNHLMFFISFLYPNSLYLSKLFPLIQAPTHPLHNK